MAKTLNDKSPAVAEEAQKQRKKQAKREAKVMLEVEKAKAAVQKAEKKIARAQARFEARTAHLRTLETNLAEFRTPQEESEVSAPVPDEGFDHQQGQPEPENNAAGLAEPQTAQSDQEHHADIPSSSSPETETHPSSLEENQEQQPESSSTDENFVEEDTDF